MENIAIDVEKTVRNGTHIKGTPNGEVKDNPPKKLIKKFKFGFKKLGAFLIILIMKIIFTTIKTLLITVSTLKL